MSMQSYEKAVELYLVAAEKDNAYACYSLGILYESGQGVTKSYPLALKWYEKAASLGEELAAKAASRVRAKM